MSGEVLPGAEGLPELGKHNFQGAPGGYPGGSVASVQEMSASPSERGGQNGCAHLCLHCCLAAV